MLLLQQLLLLMLLVRLLKLLLPLLLLLLQSCLASAFCRSPVPSTAPSHTTVQLYKSSPQMAEYSANLYAKSDEERKSYIEYYRKYYR